MADGEDVHVCDNLTSLDVKTVDESTVVKLLKKRYTHDKIYVSIFCFFQLTIFIKSVAQVVLIVDFGNFGFRCDLFFCLLQTAIDNILVSLNPFKPLPIYGLEVSWHGVLSILIVSMIKRY